MKTPLIPTLLILLSQAGCSGDSTVKATVRDVWGHIISGATLRIGNDQVITGADGRVEIPSWSGERTIHVGREGYIPTSLSHTVPVGEDVVIPALDVSLYRKPEVGEIYLIGHNDYERMDSRAVERKVLSKAVGTELLGIRMPPTERVPKVPQKRDVELVWSAAHDHSVVEQQKPRVKRLDWVEEIECTGTLGLEQCEVALHVPQGESPLGQLELLGSERDQYFHVFRVPGPLASGNYALYFEEVLDLSGTDYTDLNETLRKVYPFIVR
jgi:hypothetical protein